MALPLILPKAAFEALSDVEKAHYNPAAGDTFLLDCPGAVPKAQLDEFRTNNIALKAQVETFAGIDPVQARDLMTKKEEIEAAKSKNQAEIDRVVNTRVEAVRLELTTKLQETEKQRDEYKSSFSSRLIEDALVKEGTELGLRGTAHEDFVARGMRVFSIGADGKTVVAVDKDGNPVYDGAQQVTPKNWAAGMVKSAPHLFEDSAGGGTGDGQRRTGPTAPNGNPFAKDTWNLTAQGALIREDKAKARTMAAQAGVVADF